MILTDERLIECKRLLAAEALIGHRASLAMIARLEAAEAYLYVLLDEDNNNQYAITEKEEAWYASKGEATP